MLTYLFLHLNKWKKRPFLYVLLFTFPLLATVILYPLLKNTADETAVPVAIVDQDDSGYSETILERIGNSERIRFTVMDESEAEEAVRKGSMEAAFVLEDGLESALNEGDVDDVITWIRADESLFDVYAKEAVGAEVMRLAMSARAGLRVEQEGGSFEEAFDYSEQYWEPEPLFQMSFSERSPENQAVEAPKLESWQVLIMQVFFLYGWVLAIFFLRAVQDDEREGRLQRIELVQQTKVNYFISHFLLFGIVGAGSFLLGTSGLFYITGTERELVLAWLGRGVVVMAVTLFVTWCLFMGAGRKRWVVPVLVLVALASFMLTVSDTGFTGLWPHCLLEKGG
ncbi:ABC transporter permease [Halobacillus litoralis]|uniref:ABC transporter permease n=1 Tax=Halobacillus litoralis TaxID=45668 RepID=UPI001CD6013E|nr:ABC transporter permease [Halobacillus litoralis]MCA0970690.1 ABC transporter permease [Halobacillus litoralis]